MIESQFAYCPLIWMFCSKTDLQRVEKVQYKSLQVVYNNYMATYDELLALDNKLKIHQRHLQFQAIEIYKSKNKLKPNFMRKTYKEKNIPYSLRRGISLFIPKHSEIWNKLINFRGNVLWNNLPIKLNLYKDLSYSSSKVKTYHTLAGRVKHKEFWLKVVLFLNFKFVLFYSLYVCKYF